MMPSERTSVVKQMNKRQKQPYLWWVMNGWVSGPFFLHCIFYIAERFSCGMEAGITEKEKNYLLSTRFPPVKGQSIQASVVILLQQRLNLVHKFNVDVNQEYNETQW